MTSPRTPRPGPAAEPCHPFRRLAQAPINIMPHTLADMLGYRDGVDRLEQEIIDLIDLAAELCLTLGLGAPGQWEILALGTHVGNIQLVPTPGPASPWPQLHEPELSGWVQACLGGDDGEPANLEAMERQGRAMATYLGRPVLIYHLGNFGLLASTMGWRLVPGIGMDWFIDRGRD